MEDWYFLVLLVLRGNFVGALWASNITTDGVFAIISKEIASCHNSRPVMTTEGILTHMTSRL